MSDVRSKSSKHMQKYSVNHAEMFQLSRPVTVHNASPLQAHRALCLEVNLIVWKSHKICIFWLETVDQNWKHLFRNQQVTAMMKKKKKKHHSCFSSVCVSHSINHILHESMKSMLALHFFSRKLVWIINRSQHNKLMLSLCDRMHKISTEMNNLCWSGWV